MLCTQVFLNSTVIQLPTHLLIFLALNLQLMHDIISVLTTHCSMFFYLTCLRAGQPFATNGNKLKAGIMGR